MKFATETLATSFRRGETGAGHFRRFKGWDYSNGASFFITLALEERRPLFGRVEGGAMHHSPLGEEVLAALEAIPRIHPEITLYGHVVMPDHVHFNCHLAAGLENPIKVLGRAISGFKAVTTRSPHARCACGSTPASGHAPCEPEAEQYPRSPSARSGVTSARAEQTQRSPSDRSGGARPPGVRIWRLGYHDHLCLSRSFIDSTERYIAYNPLKWEVMYGAGHALRVVEPLASPRLNIGDYWKGVGNLALLGVDFKMVSLRISRQVASPAAIAKVVKRLEAAVDKGYVVISGFISRGEKAVRDMLCRRRDARFIRVLPSCIPNRRFKPESIYVKPFSEGRYLEIGRGNDEVAFGRGACLDINAEIIEIATAGEGLAIYWKGDGAHILAEHSSAINAGVEVSDSAITAPVKAGDSAINAGEGKSAIKARSGGVDLAIEVDGGQALQQCCLPGFDPSNDGQTGFGQKRRGL